MSHQRCESFISPGQISEEFDDHYDAITYSEQRSDIIPTRGNSQGIAVDAQPKELVPAGGRWPLFVIGCSLVGFVTTGMLFRTMQSMSAETGIALILSVGVLSGWVYSLGMRKVLFVDQALPLCLALTGVLGIGASLVPDDFVFPVGFSALAVSLVTLIFFLKTNIPESEIPKAPGYARGLITKPLAYLFAFSAGYGLCFGMLSQIYNIHAEGVLPLTTLGAGALVAGCLVYAVRLKESAASGLDIITRVAMIALLASWLLMLVSIGRTLPLALFALGAGLFFYLIERMAVDLQQAFGLSRWISVLVPLSFSASCAVGGLVGWLFAAARIDWASPSVITVFCIIVIASVTIYGLSSKRIWTAYDLQSGEQETEAPSQGAWKTASEKVYDEHRLTRREREIFELLAKGRNAAYVGNALCISNHTVKSHMLKIYRKLGIHSQQELINLVEDARRKSVVS